MGKIGKIVNGTAEAVRKRETCRSKDGEGREGMIRGTEARR